MFRILRIGAGAAVWLALVGGLWWAAGRTSESSADTPQVAQDLWQFAAGRRQTAAFDLPAGAALAVGDPVFVVDGPHEVRQVGEVARLVKHAGEVRGEVLFYASSPTVGAEAELVFYRNPDSMEWVLKTLLPPERREQIAREITSAFEAHHEEILAALRPVVEDSLRQSLAVVEQDLSRALRSRRSEIQSLSGKYQEEIVEEELIPLVRREIFPLVRRRAQPLAEHIGHEMWDRASLWRFGWRAAADKVPFTNGRRVDREWSRFLDEEAIPVLERHTEHFVRLQQHILSDMARNPEVRAAVRRNMSRVLDDPQLQRLVWSVFREVVIDNPRLHAAIRESWTSPRAQAALRLTAQRLEPTATRIGQMILGSPEEGITPEFARVLRNQVLGKDRRWLVLNTKKQSGAGGRSAATDQRTIVLRIGRDEPINPFVRLERSES